MNYLMEINLLDICRLCHKVCDEFVNTFDIIDNFLVSDSVKLIIGINFKSNDNQVSMKICLECFEIVNNAAKLRRLAAKNEDKMRNMLINRDKYQMEFLEETSCYQEDNLDEEYLEGEIMEIEKLDDNIKMPIPISNESKVTIMRVKSLTKIDCQQCEFCLKRFANTRSLINHKKKFHEKYITFICDLCGENVLSKKKIEMHLKSHQIPLNIEDNSKLEEFISLHFPDFYEAIPRPRGYRCTFCPFNDNDLNIVLDHLQEHEDFIGVDGGFCILCPKLMTSMDFMIEHTKEHNRTIKTQRCLICNREFAIDQKFLRHLDFHKKNENEFCECPQCGKKFTNRSRMQNHIENFHENKSLFCCPECGLKLGSSTSLSNHVKRHRQKDKFSCPFCPKKFSSRILLNSHKISHSTDQPFTCHICDKKFKRPETLKEHLNQHEGKQKRIPCEICPMIFKKQYALNRHMLTHTGLKPHKCEYCSKAYAQKNDLVKHLRIHLGENTYMCEFPKCTEAFRVIADLRVHQRIHYAKK